MAHGPPLARSLSIGIDDIPTGRKLPSKDSAFPRPSFWRQGDRAQDRRFEYLTLTSQPLQLNECGRVRV